jgi:hypothetical protein
MRLALLFALLAFVNTCQDDDITDPNGENGKLITCLPMSCIDEKIRQFISEPVSNPRASITVIETKTTHYFYIPARCCDIPSQLLDAGCNLICNPDGGIAAREGSCPEIKDEIRRSIYWEDSRQ